MTHMPSKSRSRAATSGTVADVLFESRLPKHGPPIHPGEMLREDLVVPLGLTKSELQRQLNASFPRLNGIINLRRDVKTDSALRLSRVTRMEPRSGWGCRRIGT
jgi:addiction module HigA family antidote